MKNTIQHQIDIIVVLAQKDFKIRYRNSILGFLWSLLNPLAYMLILWIVFSQLVRVTMPNFAAWILVGLLVWRYFAIGTSQGLSSLIANPSLINKIYVPRRILVLSNGLANFLGAVLEFIALLPILVALGLPLTWYAFFFPAVLLGEFFLVLGVSLALSALNLRYRDFYQLWEIALQLGFFLCPIAYDSSLVPARFRFFYSLNPVTRLIESARSIFRLVPQPPAFYYLTLFAGVVACLLVGNAIFHRMENRFAEEL